MTTNAMTELAKKLRELKTYKKSLDDQTTEINKEIVKLETVDLPKLMEDAEQDSFRVEGVGTVYLQTETYVSVLAGDRERLYEWLEEQGHHDLVVSYVFPQTLKAFVKEQEDANLALPDFVKTTHVPTARIRAARS